MIVALDLESSGLIPNGMQSEDPAFPWPVQVGMVRFDLDDRTLGVFGEYVLSEGRKIHDGAAAVHGVSSRQAARSGFAEHIVIGNIIAAARVSLYLVGWNIDYDIEVIRAAICRRQRHGRRDLLISSFLRPGLRVIDLMKLATPYCRFESGRDDGSYRWPKLRQACHELLGEPLDTESAHDALDDAQRARRLFHWLRREGAIEELDAA